MNSAMLNAAGISAALLLAICLAGCRTVALPAPPADPETVRPREAEPVAEGRIRIEAVSPAADRADVEAAVKRIRIGSQPWQAVAGLPHVVRGLPPGAYDVRLAVEGFATDRSVRHVRLSAGRSAAVRFLLKRE